MPYSKQLFDNLPMNIKYADEPVGVFRHICDAIQPNLNLFFDLIAGQEFFYDPELTSRENLDWLQQLVGLAPRGRHYLGLGLNPRWDEDHKREVIQRAWKYWQIKGTEPGIREAIWMWLQWEPSFSDRLKIVLPFGKVPTATPPNWWDWQTPYGSHLNQAYEERQHFGSGDAPGQRYTPEWSNLEAKTYGWDYLESWSDRELVQVPTEEITHDSSHLGPMRPWMHFRMKSHDWNQVFPDIFELNPEIWEGGVDPTVFGWMNMPAPSGGFVLEENKAEEKYENIREFDIDGMHYGDWWPYAVKSGATHEETFTTETEFGVWPGWGFAPEWWAGVNGLSNPESGGTTAELVAIEGIWPAAQWSTDVFSSAFPQAQVVQSVSDGNYRRSPFRWLSQWNSGFQWYYPPKTTSTTIGQEDYLMGGDCFYAPPRTEVQTIPNPDTPATLTGWPGRQFYSPYQTVTQTETRTIKEPDSPCTLGIVAEVPDGEEITVIPGKPAEPANLLLEPIAGYSTDVLVEEGYEGNWTGFRWGDWWLTIAREDFSLSISYEEPTIDTSSLGEIPSISMESKLLEALVINLDSIQALNLDTLAPIRSLTLPGDELIIQTLTIDPLVGFVIDMSEFAPIETLEMPEFETTNLLVRKINGLTNYIDWNDCFQANLRLPIYKTVETLPSWQIDLPTSAATHLSVFGKGDWFYYKGGEATPARTEIKPKSKTVRLCNVFHAWSRRQVLNLVEYRRLIDQTVGWSMFDFYPILEKVSNSHNWKLVLETERGMFILPLTAMFWTRGIQQGAGPLEGRSQAVDLNGRNMNLYMEFLMAPKESTYLKSATLLLEDKVVRCHSYHEPVSFSALGNFGFRFNLPFRFPNGAETLEDSRAIDKYYPILREKAQRLGLADHELNNPGDTIVLDDQLFFSETPSVTNLTALLEQVDEDMTTILQKLETFTGRDEHDTVIIDTPDVVWSIPIPARFIQQGKEPSVTVLDEGGEILTPDVDYRYDQIVLNFSQPKVGRVLLN